MKKCRLCCGFQIAVVQEKKHSPHDIAHYAPHGYSESNTHSISHNPGMDSFIKQQCKECVILILIITNIIMTD